MTGVFCASDEGVSAIDFSGLFRVGCNKSLPTEPGPHTSLPDTFLTNDNNFCHQLQRKTGEKRYFDKRTESSLEQISMLFTDQRTQTVNSTERGTSAPSVSFFCSCFPLVNVSISRHTFLEPAKEGDETRQRKTYLFFTADLDPFEWATQRDVVAFVCEETADHVCSRQ